LDPNCEHEINPNAYFQESSDIGEETVKNIVSTKGKFVSLLQARNLCKFFFLFLYLKFIFILFI
jgi:hypothetical protein